MKVSCPGCRRETEFGPGNRWRPFCSERCRSVDLGAWASGGYRIAGEAADETVGDEPADDSDTGVSPRPRA